MKIFYCLVFLLLPAILFSQSINWEWARGASGIEGLGEGWCVATDKSGNAYISGGYSETIIFGADTLTGAAYSNVFLTKYNAAGQVIWATNAVGNDGAQGISLVTDNKNNIYLTGYFYGDSIRFGSTTLYNGGSSYNIFVTKYDSTGQVLWAKWAGGIGDDRPTGIAVDRSGNIYITGYFTLNITIGNIGLAGSSSLFIAKYNAAGNVLWAKSPPCVGLCKSLSIATDKLNNEYITGFYTGSSVTFGNTTLSSTGSSNIFIAKYDSSGNALWANNPNGSTGLGDGIATDTLNNVYITGGLGNGPYQSFIFKCDSAGNALWIKSATSALDNIGYNIAVDATGNAYITGSFTGDSITFEDTVLKVPYSNLDPMYMLAFDPCGNRRYGGAFVSGADDQNAVCLDGAGNAYIGGDFESDTFVIGNDIMPLTGEEENVFIAKFKCGTDVTGNINYTLSAITICLGDSALVTVTGAPGISISPGNYVSWLDATHAILKPNTTTVFTITSSICGIQPEVFTLNVINGTINISSDRSTICPDDSVEICAPVYFSSYRWSTGGIGNCIEVKTPGVYSVIVSDSSSGCTAQSNSISLAAVIQSPISLSLNRDTICPGDSAQICAPQGFLAYIWSNNATNSNVPSCVYAKVTGIFNVTVVDNYHCAEQSDSVSVIVRQPPSVNISSNSVSICAGDSTQICATSAFASYLWSNHATTNCIEAQNQDVYYLVARDNTGCTAQSNSISLTVGQLPSLAITAYPDTICSGDSTMICATAVFYSYNWSNNATGSCIEAESTGTYSVTATNANNGCTAQSNALTITVLQGPTVTVTANSGTICAGNSVQICATGNFLRYMWSNNANTLCFETQTPGTYYVIVSNGNGCGGVQSNSVIITAGEAPFVTIGANPDTICSGDSAQICPNSDFSSYSWSNNANTQCIKTCNAGTYFLMVTDSGGCTAQSNAVTISLGHAPSVTISAQPDTICSGDSAQICAGSNFAAYVWNPPFGAQGACIEARNPGAYYLIATDNNGCTAQSNPVNINFRQAATPSLTANPDSICSGDSAQICATQGFATYLWNPAIGGTAANCIQVYSPGVYSVAVTDNSGCTAQSNPIGITVLQTPTVNLSAPSDSICPGDSAQLCATAGFVFYNWSPAIGGTTGSCIEVRSTGTFNVTVTDNHSCTAQSNSLNITVGNTLTTTITANADSICPGDTAKICAPLGFATYTWNSAGTTGNCIHAVSTGNYYVSVKDNNGCSAQSNTIAITARQVPTATITANPPSFCPGGSAQICTTPGYALYRWTYNNNNSNCIEVQRADNYQVTVTDNNGCTATSNSLQVTLQSAPPVTITAQPQNICPGDSSQICAPQGYAAYLWNPAIGGIAANCIHTANAGDYNLTVTDNNGCTALSNHININVYPKLIATITTGLDTICPGDSTRICAPSTLTFSAYLWNSASGGATATTSCIEAKSAGDYYVTITDNVGCTAESNHVSITALPTPQVSISRLGDTLIAYNAINCQWYLNNESISGATQNIYVAQIKGSYTVSVTDSDGCTAYSSAIIYTGIYDINAGDNISVFPNPTTANWQLTVGNEYIGAQLEILAADGKLVYKSEIKTTHSEIEALFAGGVYLLRVITGAEVVARKLVKL